MTDIVQRLRSGEVCINNPCRMMDARSGCACAEAADEIERLRAERDDWFDGARKDYLDERNARMDANVREYAAMERANKADAEIERLRRELAHEHKLWAALKEKADA
jgi:hypothetical protein